MTKHVLHQVPTHFRTNLGKVFAIHVVKVNIRSLWIKLLDDKLGKVIKVSRRSSKLLYKKE